MIGGAVDNEHLCRLIWGYDIRKVCIERAIDSLPSKMVIIKTSIDHARLPSWDRYKKVLVSDKLNF